MRLRPSVIFSVAIASSIFAASVSPQDVKPIAERLAAQNAIFDEQYEADLRNYPERATSYGDYRYNDKLNEYSLQAINQRHRNDTEFLARLEAIPTTGFSEQDQLSHDLLVRGLAAARSGF